MWVLKLHISHSTFVLGRLAAQYKISLTGYPLRYYTEKNRLFLTVAGVLSGSGPQQKRFLAAVRREKEVVHAESTSNFIISVIQEPKAMEPVLDPKIIWISPAIIDSKGNQTWELASFDRQTLSVALAATKRLFGATVLKFKQEPVNNIAITQLAPNLTGKQRQALTIAVEQGYYMYPKKCTLPELAVKMGCSYSTFQAHLKKAEGKLLSDSLKRL